jgi:hypothetical protein
VVNLMGALPFVPGVLRVELLTTNNGTTRKQLNRLFFKYSGSAPSNTELATLASNIETYWASHCSALLPSSGALTNVNLIDLSSAMGSIGAWAGSTAGTLSGTDMAANTAFLVTMGIQRHYRGSKPKTFLPFGTATQLTSEGAFTGSFVTSVTTGWNAFLAAIIADSSAVTFVDQVNVSYYGPPNLIVTNPVTGRVRTVSTQRAAAVVDTILSWDYQAVVSTQRRRTGRKR